MSLTSWAKRSPSNTSLILVTVIAAIGLNMYYRDRPTTEAANQKTDIEVSEVSASPKVKAFLKTIRWAEGTDGADGYRTRYTGVKFDDFSDHPRTVLCAESNGRRLCSSASGAYQFMPDTWDEKAKQLELKDFSPKSQDIAAISLLKDLGAIALIEENKIAEAVFKSCGRWASLPCFEGDTQGAYDQPVKPLPSLLQTYKENLE